MRQKAGQAARVGAALLHRLVTLALALAVLAGVAGAVLAWRLSQGPLDLPWLAHRIEAAVNGDAEPARLRIGNAALTWEGFRLGVDRPLDIRVSDIAVTDPGGIRILEIPRAEVSLSLGRLLLGELRPRALQVDGLRLRLLRAEDGSVSLDLAGPSGSDDATAPPDAAAAIPGAPRTFSLPELLAELSHPAATDRSAAMASRYSQLRRVVIRDAVVIMPDHTLGATWRLAVPEIDLTRQPRGGVRGVADATLGLGDQQTTLHGSASLGTGGSGTEARLTIGSVTPAAWARITPKLAPLAALDAPLSADVRAELGPRLALRRIGLDARTGAGTVRIGASQLPLVSAAFSADGTPEAMEVRSARAELRAHEASVPTVVQAHGMVARDAAGVHAKGSLDLDQVAFADLPQLWPEGTGGGARPWVTGNITAGVARNAHAAFALDAPPDLSDATLTEASGGLEGDDLTVWWLRPVPPVEHAKATLRIIDPDTLEITAQNGQQRPGGLVVRRATIRVTGIIHPHQFGAVEVDAAGSLPDTLALLSEPRLQLLSKHPVPLNDPAGQVAAKVTVNVPLENNVQIDQIAIRAKARLEDVHLGAIVAGRDLDKGAMDLDASNDGMKLSGRAVLAGIPSQVAAEMDFRAGPPSQVLQKITVSGAVGADQLAALGVETGGALSGTAALQAIMTERRDGRGQVDVAADLTGAALTAAPLDWHKQEGKPASGSARIRLDHHKLVAVDAFSLEGDGLSVTGQAAFVPGKPTLLRLDRIVLGRTDAVGSLRFPAAASSGTIHGTINGRTLDLSAALSRRRKSQSASAPPAKQAARSPPDQTAGAPWSLDARFDRALMGQGRSLTALVLTVENDGGVMRRLHFEGRTGPNAEMRLDIVPDRAGRRLTARSADAGSLLRAFDIIDTVEGGVLTVSGTYDDGQPDHPLSGVAEISEFRFRNAPALARVLQAMSLYGLVELVQGRGLGITRLIAPFRLAGDVLDLNDARAFNPSLGLTMKGRMNLGTNEADLEGTIVPAYFFNSLLGRVPLVGKLFSPEKGGGLFAASYAVHGPLSDPKVSVNPLSALTPGFLRGLFGLF